MNPNSTLTLTRGVQAGICVATRAPTLRPALPKLPQALSRGAPPPRGAREQVDPPVQEVQLVHGGQPRRDLARHPLQQHGLRVPPQVLLLAAQVSLQVALQKSVQCFQKEMREQSTWQLSTCLNGR